MKDTRLHDITEVCKMLGITSKTLRFWVKHLTICRDFCTTLRYDVTAQKIASSHESGDAIFLFSFQQGNIEAFELL